MIELTHYRVITPQDNVQKSLKMFEKEVDSLVSSREKEIMTI